MKIRNFYIVFISLTLLSVRLQGVDSLKYSISISVYKDLSDTYNGGTYFPVELKISKAWYAVSIGYGYFQSTSNYSYQVNIDENSKSFDIPISEISNMKLGSLSLSIEPINKNWISLDLLFGLSFGKAQSSVLNSIDYGYNLKEDKFTYLYRDYLLIKRNHFGSHFGFDATIKLSNAIGINLKSRIMQLSNGGAFFFIGTGLRLNF
jgi:hypothetical protein